MLHTETIQLQELREKVHFVTNQCLQEMQRTGRDDGIQMTDHFITMSQIECAYYDSWYNEWKELAGKLSTQGGQELESIKPLTQASIRNQQ